jgi:hypothetical protein
VQLQKILSGLRRPAIRIKNALGFFGRRRAKQIDINLESLKINLELTVN